MNLLWAIAILNARQHFADETKQLKDINRNAMVKQERKREKYKMPPTQHIWITNEWRHDRNCQSQPFFSSNAFDFDLFTAINLNGCTSTHTHIHMIYMQTIHRHVFHTYSVCINVTIIWIILFSSQFTLLGGVVWLTIASHSRPVVFISVAFGLTHFHKSTTNRVWFPRQTYIYIVFAHIHSWYNAIMLCDKFVAS